MEKVKKHATNGISQFELTSKVLNNLSQYEVTPVAKLVLLYLTSCYNPKNVDVFPKQKTIAAKIGVSERSVTRAIQELIKAGLILVECKSSNHYLLRLKNDFDACNFTKKEKIFNPEKMSDDFSNFVIKNEDKLSVAHEHEQTIEQKNNKEEFYIQKALENKTWIKNKVAYINKVKQLGGTESLVKEGKALIASENHNKAMLKQAEILKKQRENDAKLAVPPTKSFLEVKKLLMMRVMQ